MDSIIILAHNKSLYSERCLRSILITRPRTFEVIFVDNGSTDNTPELLREMRVEYAREGIELRVITNNENIGCCTARNQGIAESKGETIVFLDNDTVIVDPAWLEVLRSVLMRDRQVAIVGPKLCYPFEPHWIQCAGVGISRSGRPLFRGRGEPRDDPRYNREEEVQALISACFMFRRSLVEEIGGLDEWFNPIQFEDFDFCYRARSRGYKVIYTPRTEVYHWESITSNGTPVLPNKYLIIKNGLKFKQRWRHMFEKENGPPDEATKWKTIVMPSLEGMRKR